jgi:hypothetical protein
MSFTMKAESPFKGGSEGFQSTKLMTSLTYTLDEIEGPLTVSGGKVKFEEKHYYIQGGFATLFSNVLTTKQCLREIATFISNIEVWKTFWKQKATFKRKTLFPPLFQYEIIVP